MNRYYIRVSRFVKFIAGELDEDGYRKQIKIEIPDEIRGQNFYFSNSEKEAIDKYFQEFPYIKKYAIENKISINSKNENSIIFVSERKNKSI